ncbi:MAG: ABC transporter C-terminal domain-containing protein, partial [Pseudomonadota bacterium]|nr:ABC transporter C-terminal domain-containing protein [Pseudomonadota bacterium]
AKASPPATRAAAPARKLTYKDQRDLDRLPGEIDAIEADIAQAEEALADSALYARDPRRFTELTQLIEAKRAAKEAAELRWLEVAEMAEQLTA